MAVVETHENSLLVARYQTGVTGDGAPILRQKSLSGVKATATSEDVYDVAEALFGMVDYPLIQVRRDNRIIISKE